MPEDDDLNSVIAAATKDATLETGGDPVPDPKPAEPDPEPDPKPADPEPDPKPKPEPDPDPDPEDEPLGLSAEQLQIINDNPVLLQGYKSMQRGLTTKAQALAAERGDLEKRAKIADWVKANPQEALKVIAKQQGIELPGDKPATLAEEKTVTDVVADTMAKWETKIGKEAADVLAPLVRETAEAIARNLVDTQLQPIKTTLEESKRISDNNELLTEVNRFGSKIQEAGQPWSDEIVAAMNEQMKIVQPAEGTNTQDFLEALYDRVQFKTTRKTKLKEQVARLKKAKTTEPDTTVRPTSPGSAPITGDMSLKESIEAATAAARAELEQT